MRSNVYPFVAVVGQERLKRALLLCLVDPMIGGVLVSGEKGSAKSTLVRGLPELLPSRRLCELPLNVTADRLVGSIDVEAMMKDGRRASERGILSEADGNILYVDEVNLLSEHIANILMEVSSSGVNRIEREGLSEEQPARFALIGTMNPEEGQVRGHLLDRFGLYVEAMGEKDPTRRCEILRRRLLYENDPIAFRASFEKETEALRIAVEDAVVRLPLVSVGEDAVRFASELSRTGNCAGHRAELILTETARAIAALDGKDTVTEREIREAAQYVLPHRIREAIELPPMDPEELEAPPEEQSEKEPPERHSEQEVQNPETQSTSDLPQSGAERDSGDDVEEIESIPLELRFVDAKSASGSGKRAKVRSGTARGRYIRDRIPRDKARDIALDATIRQAVLHPKREGETLAVTVRDSDLREKVREQRTGATILFCVDASASMGVGKRMAAVKGAVMSLLTDAYQKRDTVGILTFRGEDAKVVLPLTRSVDLATKYLSSLKTGGKTPLAAGLTRSYELLKAARARNKEILPYIILLSDGRANVSSTGGDPFEEAVEIASRIVYEKINLLLLDTETGRIRFELAKKLAERSGCEYVKLSELSGGEIERRVKDFMGVR
ncbi:MAG: VWA domain-containing protein [Clostridia bacterium]|nr:VWA domain-containing protein [Clostridia bacterium]